MAAPNDHLDSYPSPSADNGLPFYQHHDQSVHQHNSNMDQHGGALNSTGLNPDDHPGVPDDPQLRANLASMMGGSFGSFGALSGPMVGHPGMATSDVLPSGSLAYAQANGGYNGSPSTAERLKDKRSKVSRACDECRRKKIRCDAQDETAAVPCSNCTRSAAKCAFSRQPMKRGPSKGYIKELAERLQSLEQQVQPPHLQQQHRQEIQEMRREMAEGLQTLPDEAQTSREPQAGEKRSFNAMVGQSNGHRQQNSRYGDAGTAQGRPISRGQQYQQASGASLPFWQRGVSEFYQDADGLSYDGEGSTTSITNFDWDEDVVEEYYRLIHKTFPLLPNSKNRLRQHLADCPASLREALLAALDCLALKHTAELLAKYPFDNPSSHTNATDLVYLQTLLLMALEADNHGPATIRGQAGPSRAEWLGRAAGVAGQLEINLIRAKSQSVMEGDRDSEERLARRVWWVLFILDRWHASSTADLLKLPENSVVLLPEDQILLGESTYHLARLSFIIGHLAAILTTTKTPSTDVMAPTNPASSLLGLTLAGEIDRFRESVESVWGSLNLVHLSYHHCHLLIKRLNPAIEPTELVGHAVKVATVLNSRLTPVTPLNHHFGALAAMTLCELCDVPKTRAEAIKGLEQMVECLGEGRGLAGRQKSTGWDGAVRELVVKKMETMRQSGDGLHSLADAAVGADEAEFSPTTLTRYGYLTALGQGVFGRKDM